MNLSDASGVAGGLQSVPACIRSAVEVLADLADGLDTAVVWTGLASIPMVSRSWTVSALMPSSTLIWWLLSRLKHLTIQ
ncbi:MAG: hypothetical protein ABJN60_15945 [Parasphingorhabdus sp.]